MLINAGALTHYSYALLDALLLCDFPIIEIHISDIYNREPFRRTSVIHPACAAQVVGQGLDGYGSAFKKLRQLMEGRP